MTQELRFTRNTYPLTKGPPFRFVATIDPIPSELHRDVADWCEANMRGAWGAHGAGCFWFYDAADAFQFKMRWG